MSEPNAGVLFKGPTSVVLIGDNRPLLNWVAYAMASTSDPGFLWVDVRAPGGVVAETDPLARQVIPKERLAVERPSALVPDHTRANVGVSAVVRTDEPPESLQVLLDFLRLPEQTQAVLSTMASAGRPRVAVLSNAQRLGGYYPVESVGPLLRAIQSTGVITIITFADAPNDGRFLFDVVIHVAGHDMANWREATLRVEKGLPDGPLRTGSEHRLRDLDFVANVLAQHLP